MMNSFPGYDNHYSKQLFLSSILLSLPSRLSYIRSIRSITYTSASLASMYLNSIFSIILRHNSRDYHPSIRPHHHTSARSIRLYVCITMILCVLISRFCLIFSIITILDLFLLSSTTSIILMNWSYDSLETNSSWFKRILFNTHN